MLAVYALIAFGFLWGYYIFFETLWDGQTPGKRRARLRVIRSDGLPIGFAEAAIRNLVRMVDFLPAYYGVGVVAMFVDGRSRRLGDLAAGTLVVRDKGMITLESLEKEREALMTGRLAAGTGDPGEPANSPSAMASTEMTVSEVTALEYPAEIGRVVSPTYEANEAPGWPVHRLNEADLRLAEDFLRRRGELANREALGRQIARRLQERMELSPAQTNDVNPEAFLLQVLQKRQES
jgi:hypothetical protein